jgi:hypothetical protein
VTTLEFVAAVYLKATGKVTTLTPGGDKYNKIVGIGNFYIQQWARERGVDWNSLYDPAYEIGTITATDTFDLDDDVRKISPQEGDFVRITHTNGQTTDYSVITAQNLRRYSTGSYVAQIGRTLKFNIPFTSVSAQLAGTLTVPVYLYPDLLINPSDTLPVDDPNWLVLMTAAEYNRNDLIKQNQYGNIIAEANESMAGMKEANEAQISEAYRPWSPTSHIENEER